MITLTSDQQDAIDGILRDIETPGARVVLCGYAGTGKTVTTAALVSELRAKGLKVVVATPTHKARAQVERALQANGATSFECVTVHRLLGLKCVRDYKTGKETFCADYAAGNMLRDRDGDHSDIGIVIVDETSMLHRELYELLIETVAPRPVVFVGDDRQLLPVKEDQVCAAFAEAHSSYRLNKVLRHDGAILNLATETRLRPVGRARFKSNVGGGSQIVAYRRRDEWLTAFLETMNQPIAMDDPDHCRALAFTNKAVEELNQLVHERRYGAGAPQYMGGMVCLTVDAVPDPIGGKPLFNSTIELQIDSADQDLFTAPYDESWMDPWNTWVLRVRACDGSKNCEIRVIDRDDEKRWSESQRHYAGLAKEEQHDKQRREYWSQYFKRKDQFGKIQPSSALTIHKSQGSTFRNVFLHWSIDGWGSAPTAQQNQLAYVGITRAAESLHVIQDF